MHAHPDRGRLSQDAGSQWAGRGGPGPLRRVPTEGEASQRQRGLTQPGQCGGGGGGGSFPIDPYNCFVLEKKMHCGTCTVCG